MCQHCFGVSFFLWGGQQINDQQRAGEQCVCALRKRICYTYVMLYNAVKLKPAIQALLL